MTALDKTLTQSENFIYKCITSISETTIKQRKEYEQVMINDHII